MGQSMMGYERRQGVRPRILIAGIGNIFLGDDAFGVEVAQRLARRKLPDGVRVVDFGIRGFDLAYALLDGCDIAILVDAVPRGEKPGTLYVIEPDLADDVNEQEMMMVETHGMNPIKVLHLVKSMGGGGLNRILIVGCEPATFGSEQGEVGLSEPVQAAVDEAIGLIESILAEILDEDIR